MADGDDKNIENGEEVAEGQQPEAKPEPKPEGDKHKGKGDDEAAQRRIDKEKAELKAENQKLKAENEDLLKKAETKADVDAAKAAHAAELDKIDILAEKGLKPSLRKFIKSTDREGILAEIEELEEHFAATTKTEAATPPAQDEPEAEKKPAAPPQRPEPRSPKSDVLEKPWGSLTPDEMMKRAMEKGKKEAATNK